MIPFNNIYNCLLNRGPAEVRSAKGTKYIVEAKVLSKGGRSGEKVIVAKPKSGAIYLHEDCWGHDVNCQGTRAGRIYNGPYSIFDWYRQNSG